VSKSGTQVAECVNRMRTAGRNHHEKTRKFFAKPLFWTHLSLVNSRVRFNAEQRAYERRVYSDSLKSPVRISLILLFYEFQKVRTLQNLVCNRTYCN